MKRWIVFGMAVAVACVAGADELLDAVLQWDQPVTWSPKERIEPMSEPVRTTPERRAPSKVTTSDDLLDEVLNSETPAVPTKRSVPSKTSTKMAPSKAAALGKGSDKTAKPTQRPITREEWIRHQGQAGERLTDRAEAALSPQELERIGQATAGEKEDEGRDRSAAAMERAARLSLKGNWGDDSDKVVALSGEFTMPLWKSAFDLAVRGFGILTHYDEEKSYTETYYTTRYHYTFSLGWHTHSYRHTRRVYYTKDEEVANIGVEALVLWRPWRGYWFSPYVGVGGRYEDSEWEDDKGGSLAFRAGTTLNLGRWWLGGEFAGGESSNEVIGTLGWRWGEHVALHAGVNRFEAKGEDGERHDGVAGGGGLTWVF